MTVHEYSSPTAERQPSIYPAPFLVQPANLIYESVCKTARSLLLRQIGADALVLIGLGCKRWVCRFCAAVKIRRLSFLTSRAKPNRLLTLTVNNALYSCPREAFDRTRAFVPELIRALRVRFGPIEYLRVTEVTKTGWPHYHLLIRSGYLPQQVVRSLWSQYTGATIVDLRAVVDKFGAYNYLTKYLTKLHRIEWTERHVSYSRAFFPVDTVEPSTPGDTGDPQLVNHHPYDWLIEHVPGMTVIQQGPMRWLISHCPADLAAEPTKDF
jgi:hypothetical protein